MSKNNKVKGLVHKLFKTKTFIMVLFPLILVSIAYKAPFVTVFLVFLLIWCYETKERILKQLK